VTFQRIDGTSAGGGRRQLEVSGAQLAMLGVTLALLAVLNDRAPSFVLYTLLLVLAYLVLTHLPHVQHASEGIVGSLAAATRGTHP
jgi:hypothetical protein